MVIFAMVAFASKSYIGPLSSIAVGVSIGVIVNHLDLLGLVPFLRDY